MPQSWLQSLTLFWQFVRPYGRWLYYLLPSRRRPSYFTESFKEPILRLHDTAWTAEIEKDRPVVLVFPMVDWHGRVQRSQQIVKALAAAGHTCVYVNPQLGLEYPVPYLLDPHPRLKLLGGKILELHVHLAREHGSDTRMLTPVEVEQIVAVVRRMVGISGIRGMVQLVAFPRWTEVAQALRKELGFPIVYDCHDLLPGFRRIAADILKKEETLLRDSDLLVFSSASLMARIRLAFPLPEGKTMIIRNGVDAELFEAAHRDRAPGLPRKAGYAGALDHWFDFESVVAAVERYPEWTFELIGRPENSEVARLARYSNVNIAGELPHQSLPGRMAQWDVAMIPFLRNELTEATNPIKLYEYLSAGLPVVSTRLPEAEQYRDLVYCADTPQQFAAQLGTAVEEDTAARRARRVAFARGETWAVRAHALLAACEIRGLLTASPSTQERDSFRWFSF